MVVFLKWAIKLNLSQNYAIGYKLFLFFLPDIVNRVKLIIEEIEREEAALREDLYSADRKFAEYYNVCEEL